MDGMDNRQELKAISKMTASFKAKMSINENNKGKKDREKFGYKVTNHTRDDLLLDKKNGTILWDD